MLQQDYIEGSLLKEIISAGTACLYSHKAEVDALNVFPVPDGDTGTNMYLTFQAALRELLNNPSTQVSDLLDSAAYGALMGARGNSGVIVSQFFRGFVKALPKKIANLTKKGLAEGLNGAYELCYQAVRQPVEGTILTIIRESANFAKENVNNKSDIKEYFNQIYVHACEILAKTPEMLPVLKQAGVVDAGGQGLVFFFEGIKQRLNGESVDEAVSNNILNDSGKISVASYSDGELLADGVISFQYCTEFILKGKKLDLEHIKNNLNPHGDCLMVVGDENTAKIHLHTNNPGIVLDFAVRFGDMYEIQIHNMVEQSQQRLEKLTQTNSNNSKYGIVAVAAGDGLERIFRSLGVQVVVNGGQTMNPSIEDLAKAASSINSSQIIILPNNKNIVLTANHVQDLLPERQVKVVPTHTIPEGLAALINYSEDHDLDDNVRQMTEKSETVVTGEVTYAVRSVKYGEMDIKEGEIIGILDGEIVTHGETPEQVLEAALQKTPRINNCLVSIYYGSDVTSLVAQDLLNRLEKTFPEAEFELYYGGQPLYYYLFSIE
jgi:DAK2 domain fusion protein YloV